MPLMIARRPTRNPGGLNIAATTMRGAARPRDSVTLVGFTRRHGVCRRGGRGRAAERGVGWYEAVPHQRAEEAGDGAWSKCPFGRAPARLLRLLRVHVSALWVARHSKGGAQPLKAQPLPLVLEKQMEHGDSKLALVIIIW